MENIAQGTDAWFKQRLGKVTASEVKNVMSAKTTAAYQNYKTQIVIEIMTGVRQESYTSAPMQWGTDNEPIARQEYLMFTGNNVVEVGFIQHPTLEAGASPDGLVNDDGTLEIKCPNSTTHFGTVLSGKLPAMYKPQVQMQLWVSNRQWCDFVSYDPRVSQNVQMVIIRVPRDDVYIAKMEQAITEFMEDVNKEVEKLLAYKLSQTLAN